VSTQDNIPENATPRVQRPRIQPRLGRSGGANTDQAAPNRRQIAVTSFDLLNGAYTTASRGRMASIIMLSIILFVLLGLGLNGLRSSLNLANVNSEIASLKERQRDATARFSASTGLPEGVSEKQLIARFQTLTNEYEKVSVQSVDVFGLYNRLVDDNVIITALSGDITELPTDGEKASTNAVDKALFDGVTEVGENEVLIKITVTATSDSPAKLTGWAQQVRDRGVFRNLVVVRSANIYTLTGLLVQDEAPISITNSFAGLGLPVAVGAKPVKSSEEQENAGSTAGTGSENNTQNQGGNN